MDVSYYELLGGEDGVRALVDTFYDLMDSLPEARTIRAMHPPDLEGSREKLFLFLCGWTGGPPLYIQRYGHPRLRARHLPFPIDDDAARAWMLCMEGALDECVADDSFRDQLARAFTRIAGHMRNQGPGPGGFHPT